MLGTQAEPPWIPSGLNITKQRRSMSHRVIVSDRGPMGKGLFLQVALPLPAALKDSRSVSGHKLPATSRTKDMFFWFPRKGRLQFLGWGSAGTVGTHGFLPSFSA